MAKAPVRSFTVLAVAAVAAVASAMHPAADTDDRVQPQETAASSQHLGHWADYGRPNLCAEAAPQASAPAASAADPSICL
ncbi:hypothetical protein Mpe_B0039 (plasmid) [Methylibium petroleiphilum PM1]|uniref:Secreted protein n=1 Tax=Methylibium petroleiphilum (strain ATCC BAA-1232 / LMG 22953 / PM1) TaxID=420662 RepID=A2SMN1_METPP|nr:hypothetical protein Mpe_B0039 [Methylibium petroleiphilum PM1]